MVEVYITEELKQTLSGNFFVTERDSPTIGEFIKKLQELERQNPNLKVGINTFDCKLWLSDFSDGGEDYEVPMLEWN